MDSSRVAVTQGAAVSTGEANSTHRLPEGPNEKSLSKRARSSKYRAPQGPTNMRHLLNAETPTPGGDSNDAATGNPSSEMCEMRVPRNNERSYVQEVKSNSLRYTEIAPHHIFRKGQVPFKRTESLVRGSLALIDIVESTTADAIPANTYARKMLPASRVQNTQVDPQDQNYGTIMEPVAQSNLNDYLEEINNSGKYMEPDTQIILRKWFGCLASGLAYIHAKDIRHENIQPSNILVKDGDIFFTFFGVSQYFQGDNIPGGTTGGPNAQLATYVAPEVEPTQPQDFKADIFSLGCVYLELFAILARMYRKGLAQWRSKQSFSDIRSYLGKLSVYLESGQDKPLREFYQRMIKVCSQMLEDNPLARPSAFMIAKFVYEAQQGSRESRCDCMIPWFSSGACTITMKIGGSRTEKSRTELEKLGFGFFHLPLSLFKLYEESICTLCNIECKSLDVFMGHLLKDHLDKIPFVKGRNCGFTTCKRLPIFETEEIYVQHLNICHGLDTEAAKWIGYL